MDVDEELESCVKGECTLIQCKVGPMRKDEVLTFKIRSRLFEETQIKVMFQWYGQGYVTHRDYWLLES